MPVSILEPGVLGHFLAAVPGQGGGWPGKVCSMQPEVSPGAHAPAS